MGHAIDVPESMSSSQDPGPPFEALKTYTTKVKNINGIIKQMTIVCMLHQVQGEKKLALHRVIA